MTKFNKWIVTILITAFVCTGFNAAGIQLRIVHAEEGYTEEDVEKIVISKAPEREYYFGDIEYGWLDEDGTYDFYPSDLTGLEFTVFYTDGESHTYSDKDLDGWELNGYYIDLEYEGYNPKIGELPVTFKYMGQSAEYTVTIKESPVSSVEIIKGPDLEKVHYRMESFYDGMQIQINYKDGTSKIMDVTEVDLYYEPTIADEDVFIGMDIEGHVAEFNSWINGEECICYVWYMNCHDGKEIPYDAKDNIADITFSNLSTNGKNIEITFHYLDGTDKKIALNPFYATEDINTNEQGQQVTYFNAFSKMDQGIFQYYMVTTETDKNKAVYQIYLLGKSYTITSDNVSLGDVDNDAQITLKDAQSILKAALKIQALSDEYLVAADVNRDGTIDLKDAQKVLKYALKIETWW